MVRRIARTSFRLFSTCDVVFIGQGYSNFHPTLANSSAASFSDPKTKLELWLRMKLKLEVCLSGSRTESFSAMKLLEVQISVAC